MTTVSSENHQLVVIMLKRVAYSNRFEEMSNHQQSTIDNSEWNNIQ